MITMICKIILNYNSKYPWESAPSKDVEAQQYVLQDLASGNYEKGNVTLWHWKKDGILYRRQSAALIKQISCYSKLGERFLYIIDMSPAKIYFLKLNKFIIHPKQ